MPNLPENTSYVPQQPNDFTSKLPSLLKTLQEKLNSSVSSGVNSTISKPFNYTSMYGGSNMGDSLQLQKPFPAYEPIGEQSNPQSKTEPIPAGYSPFLPGDTKDPSNPRWVTPSSDAVLRNWPTYLGGGQFVTDPQQPGKLVKTDRGLDTKESVLIRRGLSPNKFQIDHILPLWLGGADTAANLQLLDIPTHERKTKAQAVALTLLSHNLIDLNQAKSMAFTWQDKDLSGLPNADDFGLVPLKIAQQKAKEWAQPVQPKTPSISDVLKEIPESAKNFGKGWLPPAARELAKGALSGASLGYIPYQPDDYNFDPNSLPDKIQSAIVTGEGYLGKTIGNLLSLKGFSGMFDSVLSGAKSLGLKAFGKTVANETQVDPGIFNVSGAVQRAKSFSKFSDVLKNVGLLGAFGQISKQDNNTIGSRATRFLEDAAYGTLLSSAGLGALSRNPMTKFLGNTELDTKIPGLGTINPREYANVAGGSLMISLMSGDSIQDAMVNAATMTGFHHAGTLEQKSAIEDYMNKEAVKTALTTLNQYSGKDVPTIKKGEAVPSDIKSLGITKDTVDNWVKKAIGYTDPKTNERVPGTIDKLAASTPEMDIEQIAQKKANAAAAGRWLYEMSLPPEQRTQEIMKDVMSIGEKMRTKTDIKNFSTPEVLPNLIGEKSINFPNLTPTVPEGQSFSNGSVPITGIAGNINGGATKANIDKFFKAQQSGQASNRVFIVDSPELEPFMRGVSNSYTKNQIAEKEAKPMSNPQNNLRVFGVIDSPSGREYVPLGWVSRKFRIDENESKYAINKNVEKYKKAGMQDLERFNPEYNKDTIAQEMRKNGLNVLTADIKDLTLRTVHAQEPFLKLDIKDGHWLESQNLKQNTKPATHGSTDMSAILSKIKTNTDSNKIKEDSIPALKESTQADAAQIIENANIPGAEAGKASMEHLANTFKEAALEPTAQKFKEKIDKTYGPIMDARKSEQVYNNKENLTVKDTVKLLESGIKDGTAKKEAKIEHDMFMIPFVKDPNFQNSELKKVMFDLPIVTKEAIKEKNTTESAKPEPTKEKKPLFSAMISESYKKTTPAKPKAPLSPDQIEYNNLQKEVNKIESNASDRYLTPHEKSQIRDIDKRMGELLAKNRKIVVPKRDTSVPESQISGIKETMKELGRDAIENIELGHSELNRRDYIRKINETLRNLDAPHTNVGQTEFNKIRDEVANELKQEAEQLVYSKFSIENELGFTPIVQKFNKEKEEFQNVENTKDFIIEDTRKQLGINDKEETPKETKTFSKDKKFDTPTDPEEKAIMDKVKVASIENLAKNIETNIKQSPIDTGSYGFAKGIDYGLEKAFGKDYKKSFLLNNYLSISSKKGVNLQKYLFNTLNSNLHPLSQPKEYMKKFLENRRGETSDGTKGVEATRAEELIKARDNRKELSEEEKGKLASSGLQPGSYHVIDTTQTEKDNVKDLTRLENLMRGIPGSELGRQYDAVEGVLDAQGFLSDFIHKMNENIKYENKIYSDSIINGKPYKPKKLIPFVDFKPIINKIKLEQKDMHDKMKSEPIIEPTKEEEIAVKLSPEAKDWLKQRYPNLIP